MTWLQKLMTPRIRTEGQTAKGKVPEGVWEKCGGCGAVLYRPELERNLMVCPKCSHHHGIGARARLAAFLDEDSITELDEELQPTDALKFKDSKRYRDRITATQKKTGEKDALIAVRGALKGMPLTACAFEFAFRGGSMGSVVGEKIARLGQRSLERKHPLVVICASGGARMQEGVLSLMQMAKTSAALARLREAGVPYISVLTNPTTGGVSASLALLGDVNIGEPKALIGFAGQRVIEQTIREKLPEGFQRAEYLLEHGMIDMVVSRGDLREKLAQLVAYLCPEAKAAA